MSKIDGGGWPLPPVPGETDEDTDFLIDWVKVYQENVIASVEIFNDISIRTI